MLLEALCSLLSWSIPTTCTLNTQCLGWEVVLQSPPLHSVMTILHPIHEAPSASTSFYRPCSPLIKCDCTLPLLPRSQPDTIPWSLDMIEVSQRLLAPHTQCSRRYFHDTGYPWHDQRPYWTFFPGLFPPSSIVAACHFSRNIPYPPKSSLEPSGAGPSDPTRAWSLARA